jgi:hypothetical protein
MGFAGVDTFTYKANNGLWTDGSTPMSPDSNVTTVSIAVVAPPLVNLTIPAPTGSNNWFRTSPVIVGVTATDPFNVTSVSCADNGSPIPVNGLPALPAAMASGNLRVSADGTHNLVCHATDSLGYGSDGSVAPDSRNTGTVMIDTVPPVTTITSGPAQGAQITASTASFGFSATDASPGSGVASYQCQLDGASFAACTSPSALAGLAVGPHTFTVRAVDNAGNVSNLASVTFKVVYAFFLTPLKSPANLTSAVPIIFQVTSPQGVTVTSLNVLQKMESVFNGSVVPAGGCVPSTAGSRQTLFSQPSGATGNSSFRYVPPFQFNWDTTTASATGAGCYTVLISLSDQSVRMTNGVQLR